MAVADKTSKKRPAKPFRGAVDGKPFTPDTQPTPQAKSEGWKKLRAQRLLTQAIIAHMTKEKNLEAYISSLYANAKKGNPKAIETINKGIEDDIAKVAFTDTEGNDVKPFQFILDERYKNGSNDTGIPT
jgi:endonuclease III